MAKINRATRIALVTGEMRDCISAAGARAQLNSQQSAEAHGCSTARSLLTIRPDLWLFTIESPALTSPADYSHAFPSFVVKRHRERSCGESRLLLIMFGLESRRSGSGSGVEQVDSPFQLHQMELSNEDPC
ncbi:hypothetical protein ROHU_026926 [Labeo rohita]|uniref:Uncharacterized protein n=1 Tax=Labeo rohita TaxID=84645 RepID=A0A498ME82_LABRO|nr:hypothetical protein ROHU_026926 [Labeo rohita]